MRIVMLGTGPFAVPTFEALLPRHDVPALITRPARGTGRRRPPPSPMRQAAQRHDVPVHDPPDINSEAARALLSELAPKLLVVCDYGQILSSETLATASLGGVNLHGSLLPKYRGAAPVNWALYHGEEETGVTVIHMSPRLDAGPMLVQKATAIDPEETAVELEERLARLGVEAVLEAIDMLAQWDGVSPLGRPQDKSLVTRAPRLKKSDGAVDWTQPARQIANQVRAFKPWPGAYTFLLSENGAPLRIILDAVSVAEDHEAPATAAPGEVIFADRRRLVVKAGEQALSLDRVQPAGKRPLEISEFLCGHRLQPGDRFGEPDVS